MISLPPAPRMSGSLLRSVVAAADAAPVRRTLAKLMRMELGIEALLALPAAMRGPLPMNILPTMSRRPRNVGAMDRALPESSAILPSARHYAAQYRKGAITPIEVTERALEEARRLSLATPSMTCLHLPDTERALRDAKASADRWAKGVPLGPLDGIPIPIKEELNLEGMGYRLGTNFLPSSIADKDATCVARLRAAGAIILGHSLMTEMGMSPLGVNPQRPMPRNAHHRFHVAGGSSTGSAVAVACGVAPVALGSDGGGSVRIPAAFNGLFGIKPTFGRISLEGDGFGGSVVHLGPIGASSYDLAAFLDATAGPDPADPLSLVGPTPEPGEYVKALQRGVKGLKVGVLEHEIAQAAPAAAKACREAMRVLEDAGAELICLSLPLAQHAAAIGFLTIGIETFVDLLAHRRESWDQFGPDLQLLCRVVSAMSSSDYLEAQRFRAALRAQVAQLLEVADVMLLPTTVDVAPAITDAELTSGIADTPALYNACRFAFMGNLTGLPGGTAPVGSGAHGLPLGCQIMGDAYDEASVLAVLAELERSGLAAVREPRLHVQPLGGL